MPKAARKTCFDEPGFAVSSVLTLHGELGQRRQPPLTDKKRRTGEVTGRRVTEHPLPDTHKQRGIRLVEALAGKIQQRA